MMDLSRFGIHPEDGRHEEATIYCVALIYNIIHREMSEYLRPYNLSPGKFNVLMVIKHHGKEDGIPQVNISKHLIVTPSNMTKLIDKLEKEGLVRRAALAGDRRVNLMKITSKGSALLDKIWKGYQQLLKEKVGLLSTDEQKRLLPLLSRWSETLI